MRLQTRQAGTVGTVSTYVGTKQVETGSTVPRYYGLKTQQIRTRLKPFETDSGTCL
jgi:SH3-like domain-containing protein